MLIAALAQAVPPLEEGTRRASMGALKSYCLAVGEAVTAACVAPVMAAAAGLWVPPDDVASAPAHWASGASLKQYSQSEAPDWTGDTFSERRVQSGARAALHPAPCLDPTLLVTPAAAIATAARTTVLPLLLVAVLPHAGSNPKP